jgi:hypothetical protein
MKMITAVPALLAGVAATVSIGIASQAAEPAPSAVKAAPAQTAAPAPATVQADESGPAAGRPQFRLDDTTARRTKIQVAYNQCLLANGAQRNTGREGVAMAAAPGEDADGNPVGPLVLEPVPASASAACLTKLPLMPPELEASTNPDFAADAQAYVACMREGGLYVELLNDHNTDWTYAEGHPVPNDSYELETDCLIEAFSS